MIKTKVMHAVEMDDMIILLHCWDGKRLAIIPMHTEIFKRFSNDFAGDISGIPIEYNGDTITTYFCADIHIYSTLQFNQ